MQIVIDLHYFVNGMKSLQGGYFKVNEKKFKLNPDQEAARVAYEWFREIRREFTYNVELHKAIYNANDITELVRKLIEAPLD